jgi:hypothetical protein
MPSVTHKTFMLSVIYAECHTQGLYAECHYTECRYAKSRGAVLFYENLTNIGSRLGRRLGPK